MARTFEIRKNLCGKYEIRAAIAFEDTDERALLKAAGYTWDVSNKTWNTAVSADAARALLARGYTVDVDNFDTRSRCLIQLEKVGVALDTLPLTRRTRDDNGDYQPTPLTETAIAHLLAEVAADKAEMAARLAAQAKA